MHTLFLREHNRIARQLVTINSHWSDERVYQEARRILNAEYQHMIYNEFLPVLIGYQYMSSFGLLPLTSRHSDDYRHTLYLDLLDIFEPTLRISYLQRHIRPERDQRILHRGVPGRTHTDPQAD